VSASRVAVVQFPGVNCEAETVRALERAGLEAELFRWTRPARELAAFDAYVLPGGFSWQDRVRAGALAAKDPMLDELAARAAAGAPVLGICNGAQVLVEAGLVPGTPSPGTTRSRTPSPGPARSGTPSPGPARARGEAGSAGPPEDDAVQLALARNRMPERTGYYTRWVWCRIEDSPCVFTRGLSPGTLLPLPVAHGEGRFASAKKGRVESLAEAGQAPLRYARPDGSLAEAFPENPNGSEAAAAALCNERGNVLALMPHPERAASLGQVSRQIGGEWGARRDRALATGDDSAFGDGPGMAIFRGLARHLGVAPESGGRA
jgi:phosphoribosylformylglycinamidine synthase